LINGETVQVRTGTIPDQTQTLCKPEICDFLADLNRARTKCPSKSADLLLQLGLPENLKKLKFVSGKACLLLNGAHAKTEPFTVPGCSLKVGPKLSENSAPV
jgi:hypothetical protein